MEKKDPKRRMEEIRARLKAATPGPWKPFDNGAWGGLGAGVAIGENVEHWVVFGKWTQEPHVANAFLTAHAPSDLAFLLERVAALEARFKKLEREFGDYRSERATCCYQHEKALAEIRELARWYADTHNGPDSEVHHALKVEVLDIADRALTDFAQPASATAPEPPAPEGGF